MIIKLNYRMDYTSTF